MHPIAVALVGFAATPALGQAWIEYTSRDDRFSVNVPGQPRVEEIVYTSSLDAAFSRAGLHG